MAHPAVINYPPLPPYIHRGNIDSMSKLRGIQDLQITEIAYEITSSDFEVYTCKDTKLAFRICHPLFAWHTRPQSASQKNHGHCCSILYRNSDALLLIARNWLWLQMLCMLTSLHHLTLAMSSGPAGSGLRVIPAAVSQLKLLRTLRLPGHRRLATPPPELFCLSRWVCMAAEYSSSANNDMLADCNLQAMQGLAAAAAQSAAGLDSKHACVGHITPPHNIAGCYAG